MVQKAADRGSYRDRVRAIGLIGVDVHDKLVLAQALRTAFPDRLLFTTDLDARLMHPEVLQHTRNLVVASTLPLVPPFLERPYGEAAIEIAPFRDVYQTATFFGARYASALASAASEHRRKIAEELRQDRLFEIGRDGEVELGIEKVPDAEWSKRYLYASLSFVVLLLAWACWSGGLRRPCGPRWPAATTCLSNRSSRPPSCPAWASRPRGFALGVVIELAAPGHMGSGRTLVLAAALALLFWALVYPGVQVYPGVGAPPACAASLGADGARDWIRWQRVGRLFNVLTVALAGWILLPPHHDGGMREPFAALNGVSAWPSELLRTLAVVLFAWFLDPPGTDRRCLAPHRQEILHGAILFRRAAGCRSACTRPGRLSAPDGASRPLPPVPVRQAAVVRPAGGASSGPARRVVLVLAAWRCGATAASTARLWQCYRLLMRSGPRVGRLVLWLMLTGPWSAWKPWSAASCLRSGPRPADRALFSSPRARHGRRSSSWCWWPTRRSSPCASSSFCAAAAPSTRSPRSTALPPSWDPSWSRWRSRSSTIRWRPTSPIVPRAAARPGLVRRATRCSTPGSMRGCSPSIPPRSAR
jgi:hypothetical protein